MAANRYDQASRHLGRQAGKKLWPWLLGLNKEQVRVNRPLPTHFTLPGFPERVGDLVAALTDLESGQSWAICAEFQSEPDFDMPDRLLVILGLVRLTEKPSEEVGDRYNVGAVVINLTGQGLAQREYEWRGAGLRVLIQPRELNLKDVSAELVLRQVADGVAPVEALALIPLMKGGNDPGIMQRWMVLARQENDPQRRADLGLVTVFAELVGSQDSWREALKGLSMKESQIVKEWEAQAKAELLIQFLRKRFKVVPDDLCKVLLAEKDPEKVAAWADVAFSARTLNSFRKKANV